MIRRFIEIQNLQKIIDPKSIEQIARTDFLLSVILAQVKEFEDICVPWLEVDGKCTRAFIASLVDITSSGIVCSQHWHNTVGITISACNV